jgi:hypothetical protein
MEYFANPQFTKDVAKAEFVHENAMRTTCSFTQGGPLFIETNRAKIMQEMATTCS